MFFAENPPHRVSPAIASIPVPAQSTNAKLVFEAVRTGQVTDPSVIEWSRKRFPWVITAGPHRKRYNEVTDPSTMYGQAQRGDKGPNRGGSCVVSCQPVRQRHGPLGAASAATAAVFQYSSARQEGSAPERLVSVRSLWQPERRQMHKSCRRKSCRQASNRNQPCWNFLCCRPRPEAGRY